MKSLVGTTAVLALAGCCLVLIPSAAGTTGRGAKVVHLNAPISALAMSGTRVAYDVAPEFGGPNRILVWNVRTGMTTKVSGRRTAGAGGTVGDGVDRLAIVGNQVAWRIATGGNSEADEDVYTSSVLAPKERHVASSVRDGNQCGAGIAGPRPGVCGDVVRRLRRGGRQAPRQSLDDRHFRRDNRRRALQAPRNEAEAVRARGNRGRGRRGRLQSHRRAAVALVRPGPDDQRLLVERQPADDGDADGAAAARSR